MKTKMTGKVLALWVMAAMLAMTGVVQATTYDYATDFSNKAGNPNGVWSYGYKLLDAQGKPTGEFRLLTSSISVAGLGMAWGYSEGGQTGFMFKNERDFEQYWTSPGHVALSGDASNRTTARWTAPFSSNIDLTITFGTTASRLYIMHNNTLLAENGYPDLYNSSLHVNIGDTIDVTAWGASVCGNTQTDITIIVPGACPSADLTGDCFVDLADFALWASYWLGDDCVAPSWCGRADLNISGTVNLVDFAIMASQWLQGITMAAPDVAGMSQVDAQAAITAAGLIVGTVTQEHSGTVAVGSVISQNPAAGENVPAGSAVNMVISSGVEVVEPDITWVSITEAGFTGQMSKYETTNKQYCQFLNAALATGDIIVSGSTVYGSSGSNSGVDFAGQVYYSLAGSGDTYAGATQGGASRINYSGGQFTVDSGFENHPVTYVCWPGATAFCNYYGWRLPTEWEWQAVADYDGSYTYGCGATIDNSKANCGYPAPPEGTTSVGAFGTYGYGMADMAGNVWEWTSTFDNGFRVGRGGSWGYSSSYCAVGIRVNYAPNNWYSFGGFRVCR